MPNGLNRSRIEYRVLILTGVLGLVIWLADTTLDYLYYFEGSWTELLFINVPSHELYLRTVPIVVLLVFGLAISALLARQKRIELDLRAREKDSSFLAALVASSDDAIIGKNLDGAILSWNEGAEPIYGYSAAEAVGQSVAMLLPPDRADELAILLAKIKRGERVEHFQTDRLTKDGRRLVMSLTISPIRDIAGRFPGADYGGATYYPRLWPGLGGLAQPANGSGGAPGPAGRRTSSRSGADCAGRPSPFAQQYGAGFAE